MACQSFDSQRQNGWKHKGSGASAPEPLSLASNHTGDADEDHERRATAAQEPSGGGQQQVRRFMTNIIMLVVSVIRHAKSRRGRKKQPLAVSGGAKPQAAW